MEEHQHLSNSPYLQPVRASVAQPAIFPSPSYQQQSNQSPSRPRLDNQLGSNEQPSMICGFTLTELAQVAIQVAGIIIAAVFGAWAVKSFESANIANRLAEDSLSQSDTANRLAQGALEQSLYANLLAIINLCLSDQFRDSVDCPAVLQEARFASIIHRVIPTLSTISSRPSTPATITSISSRPSTASTPAPITSISVTVFRSTIPPSTQSTETSLSTAASIAGPQPDANTQLSFGAIVGIIIAVVVAIAIFCLLLIRYRRAKRSRF